jgi:hypothetical protein
MNLLLKSVRRLLLSTLKFTQLTFKHVFHTYSQKLTGLQHLPKRYNVLICFYKPDEWVGFLVNLVQILKGKKYPEYIHTALLVRKSDTIWLYGALTWEGIQWETINTETDDLIDVDLLIPLTCNLAEVTDNLQVLEDTEALLGKSFRYSPLGCLDHTAWLNCTSFVSVIIGLKDIFLPSDLLETLLGDNTNE